MQKIITKSKRETIKLGERLARQFRGGPPTLLLRQDSGGQVKLRWASRVIGLEGDLGAGKTTLIKGIANGLGIKKNITSPTFVLMKIYDTDRHGCKTDGHRSQIKRMCHVDAYRINSARELVDIGILEYINNPKAVVIIEWAEKVKEILPKDAIWVRMKYRGSENEREIEVNNK